MAAAWDCSSGLLFLDTFFRGAERIRWVQTGWLYREQKTNKQKQSSRFDLLYS